MSGLMTGGRCLHDQQDFVSCENYTETFYCKSCGEILIRFVECL